VIGVIGVLIRRNALIVFMSVELMLNAANLAFVTFASYNPNALAAVGGQIFVFFVMTVAAAEVAVGLALIVAIFRSKNSINIDEMNSLKG
jgi:NADH-quinone oxidoreductase subunit K